MPPSQRTARVVWVKCGGTCSICRNRLIEPFESSADTHLLGEVAHIVAEAEDGPRGESPLSLEERNREPNLMLLCQPDHTRVDDDVVTYDVGTLHRLKREHEEWVASRLALETPWRAQLHNLYYINVPRLSLLAASAGCPIDVSLNPSSRALSELGLGLVSLMRAFEDLLAKIDLKAVELEQVMKDPSNARGLLVSFDRRFRTRNIRRPEAFADYDHMTGDLLRDPHIYTRDDGLLVVVKIDPRWITTSTAFAEFRPSSGSNRFSGLGIVNSLDPDSQTMSISPFVLGLPLNPFMAELYGISG